MPRKSKPAVEPGGHVELSYVTDRQIAAHGVEPENAAQIAADAQALYEHVNRASKTTRDDLIRWANSTWGDGAVDRFNEALEYLLSAGKIVAVP